MAIEQKEVERLLSEVKLQRDWTFSWKTADELASVGAAAIPRLIEALGNEDGYVREVAANALGKIGDRRAVGPLIQAMQYRDDRVYEDDEDCEARVKAATALGCIADPGSVEPLIETLKYSLEKDITLSWYVIGALGMLGDRRAIPILESISDHADIDVRKSVKGALNKLTQ